MIFQQFSSVWITNYKSVNAKNTQRLYNNIINNHLNPIIGNIEFGDIKKSDLQGIINRTLNRPSTCRHIKITLKQIFADAYDEGVICKNPCKGLVVPTIYIQEKRVLSNIEKEKILDIDFTPMERMFVYIIYGCGLRKGEALALEISDFKNGNVCINKNIAFESGIPYLTNTKSQSSIREIPIPNFIEKYIAHYKKDGKLFEINGKYLSDAQYAKMWKSIVNKIDCITNCSKDLTAHVFRHNYATMLYYSNISIKMAAKLMGHSNTDMIMKVYAHLNEQKENLREQINALF
jgi:integrase